MNTTAELKFPPLDDAPPTTAIAAAPAQALDLEKIDLRTLALAKFASARKQAADATKTLTGVVHDLSTQAKVDGAKSLRWRLIGQPMADTRKVTKGIKSTLAAASRAVGEEEDRVLAAFTAADALITPQIEAREAELEAERQAKAQAEAERKAGHEANLQRLAGAVQRARDAGADSTKIADGIAALDAFEVTEAWEEYRERGEAARLDAIAGLRALHDAVKAAEEQAAENERLRVLAEQQAAELAALRKAEAERQAKERAAAEAKAQAEAAEAKARADALAAEELAAQRAESDRLEKLAEENRAKLAAEAPPVVVRAPEAAAPAPVTPEPAAEIATLSLSTIRERLGFMVTGDFLADTLGIHPARQEKAAKIYTEAQYQAICRALISHVGAMAELYAGERA